MSFFYSISRRAFLLSFALLGCFIFYPPSVHSAVSDSNVKFYTYALKELGEKWVATWRLNSIKLGSPVLDVSKTSCDIDIDVSSSTVTRLNPVIYIESTKKYVTLLEWKTHQESPVYRQKFIMFDKECRVSKTLTLKPKDGSVDVISYAVEGHKLVGLAVEIKNLGKPWHLFHFWVDLKSEDLKHIVTKIEDADKPLSDFRQILAADFEASITSSMHRGVLTTVFINQKKKATFVMWIDFSSNPLQPTARTAALQRRSKGQATPEPMRLLPSSLFSGTKYDILVFPHRVYKIVHATKKKSPASAATETSQDNSIEAGKPQITPKLAQACINLDEHLKDDGPKRGDQLRAIVYTGSSTKRATGILSGWRKARNHVLLSGLRVKNSFTRRTELSLQIWEKIVGKDDEQAYKCRSIRIDSKTWSHLDDEFTMVTAPA